MSMSMPMSTSIPAHALLPDVAQRLLAIAERPCPPTPWSVGTPIPWHDVAFSERMLCEHLSQAHDAASRRAELIDAQVAWLHGVMLAGQPSRVLDLACGPGLYLQRLAALGHSVSGIDIAPAAVDHARALLPTADIQHGDLRSAEYGSGYDLLLLNYGGLNMFTPHDARVILQRSAAALRPGGLLVLELHPLDAIRALGERPASWRTAQRGLFGERPYLVLEESFWDASAVAALHRLYVIDLSTATTTCYGEALQGYVDADLDDLLTSVGFQVRDDIAAPQVDAQTPGLNFIMAELAAL